MKKWGLIVLFLLSFTAKSQTITTVASTGGGIVYDPGQLFFDKFGNLYIGCALCYKVLKIDTAGIITIFAGTGTIGSSGDGGPATAAEFNQPGAITTDTFGNVYIGDAGNGKIRKVDVITGIITTFAGTVPGYGGDGGPATAAMLNCPDGFHFDKYGNLYVADYCNDRIRKINTSGIITTIAGNGIMASAGDGGPATAAECYPDYNMCMDAIGDLFFCDNANSTIRKIDTSGIISTIAGDSTGAYTYSGDDVPALGAPMGPGAITFEENGLLLISDNYNNRIRMVDSSGIIHTIVGDGIMGSTGDGGPATTSELDGPVGIVFDQCGNLYIAQVDDPCIRKVLFDPLSVTPTPTVNISATTSDTVCLGTFVTLNAAVAGGGSVSTSYNWYVNGVIVSTSGSSYSYIPANGDSIRCTIVSFNPCSSPGTASSNVVHIVIDTPFLPTINITASPGDTVCMSEVNVVTFSSSISYGGTTPVYQWIVDGVHIGTGLSTYSYSPANGDSIRCVLTSNASCVSPSIVSSNTIDMVVDTLIIPTISIASNATAAIGSIVTINAAVANAGSSYIIHWYDNGVFFSSTTVPVVTYTKVSGTDVITATVISTSTGCYDSTTSGADTVMVNLGIHNMGIQSLDVYPNPVTNKVHIDGDAVSYKITRIVGTTLLQGNLAGRENSIDISSFMPGIYMLEIMNNEGQKTVVKIIKQ